MRHAGLVVGLLLLAGAAAAAPRHVLVLTRPSPATPPAFWESFVLALRVQLGSYDVGVVQQEVAARGAVAASARARGRAHGALATIWIEPVATTRSLKLFVLDLTRSTSGPRSLPMPPGPHIDRSLAVAARTLLQAPLAAPAPAPASGPAAPAAPAPAPASLPASAPSPTSQALRASSSRQPPLFFLGADYVFELLPGPGEHRQGPDVHASLCAWRQLEVQLALGVRIHEQVATSSVNVDRTVMLTALGAGWRWALPHRLSIQAGLRGQMAWVLAVADEPSTGRRSDSNLFELLVGAESDLAWRLTERIRLRVVTGLQWIARGHDVAVRGEALTTTGRVVLRLGAGVVAAFW